MDVGQVIMFKLFRQVQALSTILSSGRLPFFGNFAIVTGTLPLKLPKKVNFRLKTGKGLTDIRRTVHRLAAPQKNIFFPPMFVQTFFLS